MLGLDASVPHQDLARLLPGLASVRRPSKSNIVNNSISHLSAQRGYRLSAARELRTLLAERDELLTEVNSWRSRNGVDARESTGVTAAIEGVLKVEEETFGVFTAGFGPDGDDDDEDGGDGEGEGSFDGGVSAPDARTSFSSDASSAFNQAYNGQHHAYSGTSAAAAAVASNLSHHMNGTFFGHPTANVKTEAISPASDSSSPRSANAGGYHVEGASPHDAEKVTSWAAEQLLAHLRHQQRQAEEEQQAQQHRDRSDSLGSHHSAIPLANAHHGSNPFTANLLATIAAQQQRSSFDMGSNFSSEDVSRHRWPPISVQNPDVSDLILLSLFLATVSQGVLVPAWADPPRLPWLPAGPAGPAAAAGARVPRRVAIVRASAVQPAAGRVPAAASRPGRKRRALARRHHRRRPGRHGLRPRHDPRRTARPAAVQPLGHDARGGELQCLIPLWEVVSRRLGMLCAR